jgi:ATP-dependent helicase/nuclease subunit B
LARREPELLARPMAYDAARWKRTLTPFDGYLSSPDLLNSNVIRNQMIEPISASRIEIYAKCPYLFFLKRIMALEPWDEATPLEAMDPLERGSAVHAILENFMDEFGGIQFLDAPVGNLRTALLERANSFLQKVRPAGLPDMLWEIELARLLGMLEAWLIYEKSRTADALIPMHFERSFGVFSGDDRQPSFRVGAGRHTFDFRGRIDRIDLSEDGKRARVVDYKTGRMPEPMRRKNRTPLMAGEKIQVVIYREALSALDDLHQVANVQGEYLHLQPASGETAAVLFDDEAGARLPAILEIIGDGIAGGAFFPQTGGIVWPEGNCRNCDYQPICGKDRKQREMRKAEDDAVVRFRRMREIDGFAATAEEEEA